MMNKINKYLPALLIAGGFVFGSCSKPDSIGVEVLPDSDVPGVFYTDTITVTATTIREDSLRSDEAVTAFNHAGSFSDPVFGRTSASFYSQVRLPNNNANFSFGTDPVIDSVVLTLAISDFYGDTLTPLTFEVYRIDESLFVDSTYYSTDVVTTNLLLGTISDVAIHPKDSVLVNDSLRAPHLRLRLDDSFGTDFINSGNANFIDNNAFIAYFKGIHVKTNDINASGQGSILLLNLLGTISKLTFYYTNTSSTSQKIAYFEVNTSCPRFNHFEHDFTTAEFGNTFPVSGNNKLYLQSMAGVKVRLHFPNLKNFSANGPVAINKAELLIPAIDNGTFKSHANLFMLGVDSSGADVSSPLATALLYLPDLNEAVSYFGGAFETTSNTYKFNISRYVQQTVSGKINNDFGLSLISSGGANNASRTIVPGLSIPENSIRLRVTYSKLD